MPVFASVAAMLLAAPPAPVRAAPPTPVQAAPAAPLAPPRVPTRVSARALGAVCAENAAACLTYVMAVIDTTQNAAANAGVRVNYCIPAGFRNDQVADIALRYVRAHPELAGDNGAGVVVGALRESFPCP